MAGMRGGEEEKAHSVKTVRTAWLSAKDRTMGKCVTSGKQQKELNEESEKDVGCLEKEKDTKDGSDAVIYVKDKREVP